MTEPMTPAPAEELAAMRELAAGFARRELADRVHEHEFPWPRGVAAVVERAREAGLLGVNLPAEWGGSGLDAGAVAALVEPIAATDAGVAAVLFTHAAALELIAIAAADDPHGCRSIYQQLAAPDGAPLAFASYGSPAETAPLALSGPADRPRVAGEAPLVVLGGIARRAVVAAAPAEAGPCSYFLIDLAAEGVRRSAPVLTLGLQAAQAVDLTLDGVVAAPIGAAGQGARYFARMRARLAPAAAALSLGLLEGSFRAALDYARQRHQGGRNIVEWSAVGAKLAEMAIQIEVGRACLRGLGAGAPADGAAEAVALHLGELACAATVEGVQILGGNGYMKEYGQEKRMRDARQARSLLGASGPRKLDYLGRIP